MVPTAQTQLRTAENWYYSNFRRDNIEVNSFDASMYVKLREVSLNYRLSSKYTAKLCAHAKT
jgi:hypothetical protein